MAGSVFKVEFDTDDLKQFIGSLSKFSVHGLLDNIGALVETQTQDRFESKTDPEGRAWEKWSAKYTKSGKGISLLRNTQRLFSSINYQIKGNTVEVGTNVEYAATHNYGDSSRNIPKRTFLGMGEQNKKDMDKFVTMYIKGLSK